MLTVIVKNINNIKIPQFLLLCLIDKVTVQVGSDPIKPKCMFSMLSYRCLNNFLMQCVLKGSLNAFYIFILWPPIKKKVSP